MDEVRLLKHYFGHERFRDGQKPLIDSILAGRDVMGVMPTGAGKSVCYQLPAIMLPGMTLVISPLISLMKDQVAADFRVLSQSVQIPLVAVDEAHCVSQWGQDFRPRYLDIARYIRSLAKRPVVGAFTATATELFKYIIKGRLASSIARRESWSSRSAKS